MKLPLTVLLLLGSSVLAQDGTAAPKKDEVFKVEASSGGARVTCPSGSYLHRGDARFNKTLIEAKDSHSGEYECKSDTDGKGKGKVFVKYRSCDNCIALEPGSIAGLIVGDVVATFVIGVSVYLLARSAPGGTPGPNKKASDRQRLVANEVNIDSTYQRLNRTKGGEYDVLNRT